MTNVAEVRRNAKEFIERNWSANRVRANASKIDQPIENQRLYFAIDW
jgi:exonuclease VII large subunit